MDAPMERCFTLATSIDLHLAAAAAQTRKQPADEATSGLMSEGETLQWQGRPFGRTRIHSSRIDGWRPFSYFREVMVEGSFALFEHEHHFALMDDGTRMRDEIRFAVTGLLGSLTEKMVRRRLIAMLKQRSVRIKQAAESEEWRRYLVRTVAAPARAKETLVHGWDKRSALQRADGRTGTITPKLS